MKKKNQSENKKHRHSAKAQENLRKRTEKLLAGKSEKGEPDETSRYTPNSPENEQAKTNIKGLIHELRVHQIELEMQNEELRRAQSELEDSRCNYSDLYDFAPVGYFTLDKKGIILEINLTGAAMLGIERTYLTKKPFSQYVVGENQDSFYSFRKRLLETATRQACELKVLRKDGKPFYAQLEGIAIFDSSSSHTTDSEGNFSYFRVAMLDITLRKQVDEVLRNAHDELEIKVEERTGELIKSNQNLWAEITERKRAEEALRESLKQLSKKNRYERIISSVTRNVHRSINLQEVLENAVNAMSQNINGLDNVSIFLVEGKEAVLKAYRCYPDWFTERVRKISYPNGFTWKTIMDGKPVYCPDVDQDTIIGPAGREAGIKSYLSMPIRLGVKTVGCVNINSFEKNAFNEEELKLLEIIAQQIETAIDNAKHAEALRESEERYRALYEDNPSMYFTVDTEGKILSVNRFGIEHLGYSAGELIGRSVFNVLHEEDKKAALEQLSVCLRNPWQITYSEFRKVCKDGSVLWVGESARAVRNVDGNTVILIVCEDITKRKLAEEQIKISLKEKEVLLKEIQHRFKNNLQVILSLFDLQTEYFKDKRAANILHETQNRVKSMALIHEQLY
ncbi:MAG: PAS domain S-box protein [Deltaproteobacteria bacterium]|nr:PAS domain S-box protein [Deltaproteobacteria bacterium]